MLWTTPAEAMALAKLASFDAEIRGDKSYRKYNQMCYWYFLEEEVLEIFCRYDYLRIDRMGPNTVESSTVEQFQRWSLN